MTASSLQMNESKEDKIVYASREDHSTLQNLNRASVLLVEDDRATRRLISASLREYCDISEAKNSAEGIAVYNAEQPDIVFLDIELPDNNGYELLEWILRNDPGAYVVMLSGHSHTANVIKAMEDGAKGFVSKPFDVDRMLHFIERCPKLH